MKLTSGFFAILLIIWMSASSYWYVCKIKDQCNKTQVTENTNNTINKPEKIIEPVREMTKEEIIEDMKSKISKGYSIYFFPENSAENNNIESSFEKYSEDLISYLNQYPEDRIEITGHTDNKGSFDANYKFGLQRAKFIKAILIKKGIKPNRIRINSKGESEPIASNETEEGKEQNRRVVIKLIDN